MCDPQDCDSNIWLGDRWRKARMSHACCACRESIQPGYRYHFMAVLIGGHVETYKHCARCYAILSAIWAEGEAAQYELDCGESWEDVIGDLPDDVARLAFMTPDEAQELAK